MLVVPWLEREARRALNGVGDASRGEWTEWTGRAFHVRRRLSEAEEAAVGPAVDIRGTGEAALRMAAVRRLYPFVQEEL